jgi:hypothetical protein
VQQRKRIRGMAVREGDRWASLVLDFDIAADGDTPEEAIRRSVDMTMTYLRSCKAEGRSLADCRRPAPLGCWLRYYWLFLYNNTSRGLRNGGGGAFDMPLPMAC